MRAAWHAQLSPYAALHPPSSDTLPALPAIHPRACSAGPNVAVIPLDGTCPLVVRHVGTPRRMAELLRDVCAQQEVDEALLQATELRLAGNAAARGGQLARAERLYTQALELQVWWEGWAKRSTGARR